MQARIAGSPKTIAAINRHKGGTRSHGFAVALCPSLPALQPLVYKHRHIPTMWPTGACKGGSRHCWSRAGVAYSGTCCAPVPSLPASTQAGRCPRQRRVVWMQTQHQAPRLLSQSAAYAHPTRARAGPGPPWMESLGLWPYSGIPLPATFKVFMTLLKSLFGMQVRRQTYK